MDLERLQISNGKGVTTAVFQPSPSDRKIVITVSKRRISAQRGERSVRFPAGTRDICSETYLYRILLNAARSVYGEQLPDDLFKGLNRLTKRAYQKP